MAEKGRTVGQIFHEFANDTTIHGLSSISKYWASLSLRIFFILCQTYLWAVMSYHMYLVIHEFLEQPTLIQTITVTERSYKYPSLTFCPREWLNVTRYSEMNLPPSALLYALSFLKRVRINGTIDVGEGEHQLRKFMASSKIASFHDLYLILANDYDNESLFCQECSTWPPKKIVTDEGVCYYFTFNDYTSNVLTNRQPRIVYNPVQYDSNNPNISILSSFYTVDLSEYITVGASENDFFAIQPIFVLLNRSFVLQITPTRHKMINDPKSACVEKRQYSKIMCEAYCHTTYGNKLCGNQLMFGYYKGWNKSNFENTPKLWSSLDQTLDQRYDDIKKCDEKYPNESYFCEEKACPPLCEEMTYISTVQTIITRKILDDLNESSLTILVAYQVRSGIIEANEIMTYTWYSFLSNVGGLVGLWCGASVMSLIQLIIYFGRELLLACGDKTKRTVRRASIMEKDDHPAHSRLAKVSRDKIVPVETTVTGGQYPHKQRPMFSENEYAGTVILVDHSTGPGTMQNSNFAHNSAVYDSSYHF